MRAGIAGLMVVALLGLAACGGDDDDGRGAFGAGDPGDAAAELGDQGGGGELGDLGGQSSGDQGDADTLPAGPAPPGEALGACDLLEKAEVEEQFGDLGAIADGETTTMGCDWQVGETPDDGLDLAPALTFQFMYHPDPELDLFFNETQWEDGLAEVRSRPGVVEVPGVADEAAYDFGTLYVRSGEIIIAVGAFTIPDSGIGSEALQAKLVTLAELVLGRL